MIVWILGLFVGLDNLAVSSSLGALKLGRGRKLCFVASCACFEALAPWVGLAIGHGLRTRIGEAAEWIGSAALMACGLLVLGALIRRQAVPGLLDRPMAMLLIPLALSLDNLAAGIRLGSGGSIVGEALLVGGIAGTLSAIGLAIGGLVRVRFPRVAGGFAVALLLSVAVFSLIRDHI
jgi:manganese efflux pump family protein